MLMIVHLARWVLRLKVAIALVSHLQHDAKHRDANEPVAFLSDVSVPVVLYPPLQRGPLAVHSSSVSRIVPLHGPSSHTCAPRPRSLSSTGP